MRIVAVRNTSIRGALPPRGVPSNNNLPQKKYVVCPCWIDAITLSDQLRSGLPVNYNSHKVVKTTEVLKKTLLSLRS